MSLGVNEDERREEAAEREKLRLLDRNQLIEACIRRKEEADTFGLDVQLDGEQYRKIIADKDTEIARLRARCDYLERYQERARALVEAHGSHVH